MRRISLFPIILIVISFEVSGQDSYTIPFKNERNRAMIPVRIGDITIPDILLDTGFAFDGVMIYNPAYMDAVDVATAKEVLIPGAGGVKPSKGFLMDSTEFYIGGIRMINQKLLVLNSDKFKDFHSNGVMGYSLFGHYATEFDFDKKIIRLHPNAQFDPGSGWTPIPIYFKKNKIPWIDVSVVIDDEEATSISTYIDFAAGDIIELLEKEAMKYRIPENTTEAYLGRGLSGDIYGKKGQISKLIIGPYEMKNLKASIAPARIRSKQPGADAIIGCGCLERFNLIFDYANQTLYLKPNSHFNDPWD